MAAGDYALAMTSVADDPQGFRRLDEAVHEIDRELKREENLVCGGRKRYGLCAQTSGSFLHNQPYGGKFLSIRRDGRGESGKLRENMHICIHREFLWSCRGEIISEELVRQIQAYRKGEFQIQGLSDKTGQTILSADKTVCTKHRAIQE